MQPKIMSQKFNVKYKIYIKFYFFSNIFNINKQKIKKVRNCKNVMKLRTLSHYFCKIVPFLIKPRQLYNIIIIKLLKIYSFEYFLINFGKLFIFLRIVNCKR